MIVIMTSAVTVSSYMILDSTWSLMNARKKQDASFEKQERHAVDCVTRWYLLAECRSRARSVRDGRLMLFFHRSRE